MIAVYGDTICAWRHQCSWCLTQQLINYILCCLCRQRLRCSRGTLTAELKTGLRGLDLQLRQLNSYKMFITWVELNWSNFYFHRFWQKVKANFCSCDFAVWEVAASLICTEVILHIELKQSYSETLESVPAVFAKLSWKCHLFLSCCSAHAGKQWKPTIFHWFIYMLLRHDLFWWLVPERITFCFGV